MQVGVCPRPGQSSACPGPGPPPSAPANASSGDDKGPHGANSCRSSRARLRLPALSEGPVPEVRGGRRRMRGGAVIFSAAPIPHGSHEWYCTALFYCGSADGGVDSPTSRTCTLPIHSRLVYSRASRVFRVSSASLHLHPPPLRPPIRPCETHFCSSRGSSFAFAPGATSNLILHRHGHIYPAVSSLPAPAPP